MVHEYWMWNVRRFGDRLDTDFLQIQIAGDFFDDPFGNGFRLFDERAVHKSD